MQMKNSQHSWRVAPSKAAAIAGLWNSDSVQWRAVPDRVGVDSVGGRGRKHSHTYRTIGASAAIDCGNETVIFVDSGRAAAAPAAAVVFRSFGRTPAQRIRNQEQPST